jgi:hypothetical protein
LIKNKNKNYLPQINTSQILILCRKIKKIHLFIVTFLSLSLLRVLLLGIAIGERVLMTWSSHSKEVLNALVENTNILS